MAADSSRCAFVFAFPEFAPSNVVHHRSASQHNRGRFLTREGAMRFLNGHRMIGTRDISYRGGPSAYRISGKRMTFVCILY